MLTEHEHDCAYDSVDRGREVDNADDPGVIAARKIQALVLFICLSTILPRLMQAASGRAGYVLGACDLSVDSQSFT